MPWKLKNHICQKVSPVLKFLNKNLLDGTLKPGKIKLEVSLNLKSRKVTKQIEWQANYYSSGYFSVVLVISSNTHSFFELSTLPLHMRRIVGKFKVIYIKYSKHWPFTVTHTIDCVCRKC